MSGAARIQRLQSLFEEAVGLAPPAREEFLTRLRAGDPALAVELAALLAHDEDTPSAERAIVDRVLPSAARLARRRSDHSPWPDIPGYRLLREIGHGGMGSVVLAEREDAQFRHQVAIKLVRGFPSEKLLERFRRERELLATLRHPNIARLFDGGTTMGGQPWLAMEYIEGQPLDDWCRNEKPSLQRRLRLFQALCSAVQHAHQKLIIHRDLKPGNVLVREDDQPVLLDFGVGKLLDEDDSALQATRTRMFTPAYASPEQLRGEAASTLSDVYALGLILFELLAGEPLRHVSGTTSVRSPSRVAETGEHWLRADARLLRGDLDNIARKALHDDPYRRYASAAALSADIQAWFAGHPVTAAADGWAYRMRKFVARHPVAVASSLAGLIALAVLSLRLVEERAQARLEAEGANQAAIFLVDLLKSSAPEATRGETLTVRGLLEQAEQSLEVRQFSRPEVKARLEMALADIHISLGRAEAAIELLEKAVQRARSPDGDPRVLGQGLRLLALAYLDASRHEDGLHAAEQALALNTKVFPPGHPEIGHTLMNLGVAKQHLRRHREALEHFHAAQALFSAAGEEYRENVLSSMHNQGWSMYMITRYEDAEPILLQTVAEKEQLLGPNHPSTLRTLQVVAQLEQATGRPRQAAERLSELLRRSILLRGEDNTTVADTRNILGSALHDLGRYEEAEAQYRAAMDTYAALGSDSQPGYAVPVNNLASLYEDQERLADAEAMFRHSLALRISRESGPWAIARAQNNLARLLLATGRVDEARVLAEEAWTVRGALEPAHHVERLDGLAMLARIENASGNDVAAQSHLASWKTLATQVTLAPNRRVAMHRMFAEFAVRSGDRGAVIAEFRAALAALQSAMPEGHPRIASLGIELASILVEGDEGERREAFALLDAARDIAAKHFSEHGPTLRRIAALDALR
jgi:tetratricopeptide (TPR) repeat protein/tRNA A-37 threonylcarbamoyl transferase component Bud32